MSFFSKQGAEETAAERSQRLQEKYGVNRAPRRPRRPENTPPPDRQEGRQSLLRKARDYERRKALLKLFRDREIIPLGSAIEWLNASEDEARALLNGLVQEGAISPHGKYAWIAAAGAYEAGLKASEPKPNPKPDPERLAVDLLNHCTLEIMRCKAWRDQLAEEYAEARRDFQARMQTLDNEHKRDLAHLDANLASLAITHKALTEARCLISAAKSETADAPPRRQRAPNKTGPLGGKVTRGEQRAVDAICVATKLSPNSLGYLLLVTIYRHAGVASARDFLQAFPLVNKSSLHATAQTLFHRKLIETLEPSINPNTERFYRLSDRAVKMLPATFRMRKRMPKPATGKITNRQTTMRL